MRWPLLWPETMTLATTVVGVLELGLAGDAEF